MSRAKLLYRISSVSPSPPCIAALDACKSECDVSLQGCRDASGVKCKKKMRNCKKTCAANSQCAPSVCEDNAISGFGTFWCLLNAKSATFCDSIQGMTKCKKICELCD